MMIDPEERAMMQLVYRYLPDRDPSWSDPRTENGMMGMAIGRSLYHALLPLRQEIEALKERIAILESR
jgi:hypothetical protein